MYRTYYQQSNGQPCNGFEEHETLNQALQAWLGDQGALYQGSGGYAYLDCKDETILQYEEHIEGGFCTGELMDGLEEYGEEPEWIVHYLTLHSELYELYEVAI